MLGVLLLLDAVMNLIIVLGKGLPGWFAKITKVCEVRKGALILKDTPKEFKVSVPPAGYAGGYREIFFSLIQRWAEYLDWRKINIIPEKFY